MPSLSAVGRRQWVQLSDLRARVPLEVLHATATRLLAECGQLIRRLAAGLTMPDWPEGAGRAINI